MASSVKFLPPAGLRGTNEQQLKQMYSYLYQMSEKLNMALVQVDEQIAAGGAGQSVVVRPSTSGGSSSSGADADVTQQYLELRALIIKTADEVYAAMDLIKIDLTSNYLAKSEFGEFQESLETTITATAQNVLLQYNYGSRLDAAEDALAGFSSYDISSLQYIKLGVIGEDEDGEPVVGIVIGKEFTTVTIDGVEYNKGVNSYSAFTSDRISFFIGDVERAYLSNETLHVTHIALPDGGKFTHGKWLIDTDNGYSIKWVGGES